MIKFKIHKRLSRKILAGGLIILFHVSDICSQEINIPAIFGGSVNQSVNSEPDGGALTIGLNLVKARRTYELAVIFDEEEKINGGEFVHKIFLNKKNSFDNYHIHSYGLRPYMVYNLVYRRAISETQKSNNLIIHQSDIYNVSTIEEPEKVTTIQHYIGFGIEKDILEHVFVNISTFAGLQLGKNNNNNKIDNSINQKQENTYLWNFKLGFGYRF